MQQSTRFSLFCCFSYDFQLCHVCLFKVLYLKKTNNFLRFCLSKSRGFADKSQQSEGKYLKWEIVTSGSNIKYPCLLLFSLYVVKWWSDRNDLFSSLFSPIFLSKIMLPLLLLFSFVCIWLLIVKICFFFMIYINTFKK